MRNKPDPLFAKKLRREQTDAEKALWRHLRDRRFQGLKFYRQVPLGPYVVDFLCRKKKFVIELDGGQHAKNKPYDDQRTKILETLGYRVVRFWDDEILKYASVVLDKIFGELGNQPPPSPPASPDPLPPGGRGNNTNLS